MARALDCQCGAHLEAANDQELAGRAREHVASDHPDMNLSDEEFNAILATAYDA